MVEIFPASTRPSRASASSSSATRSSAIAEIDPLRGQGRLAAPSGRDLSGEPLRRHRRSAIAARPSSGIRGRAGPIRLEEFRPRASCSRGPAARAAHDVRPRDAPARWASVTGRELLAPPRRARAGQTPYTLYDYLPEDFLVVIDESHVSVPADRRHVPGRPGPQGDPGRVRLPAAQCARQPAAALRGVGGAGGAARLRLGHAGPTTSSTQLPRAWWWSRSSARPG